MHPALNRVLLCSFLLTRKLLQLASTSPMPMFSIMLAQARELAIAQQNLGAIQETLTVCELHVEEVEKQQEGKGSGFLVFIL